MIKRTLFFGNDAYLSTKNKQLIIDFADKSKEPVSIPIEDIGVLVMEAYRMTISLNLISRLLDNNVALITCNEKKMPQGLMLNLDGNTTQQERFKHQINISQPLKKQLWQQTVKAKIKNQAGMLQRLSAPNTGLQNMLYWADSVRSGDPDNYEARAAAYYWANIFNEFIENFTRGRFDAAPNNLLNYGYAILRAVTARSLVASGLLPTLGIHHHNKYNAYALADDIMEPYRPYVDEIVYDILSTHDLKYDEYSRPQLDLNTEIKAELLKIPAIDVIIDNEKSPLMNAMQRTTASLFNCYAGDIRKILYPEI
jgi:CRISPR-associated protein Cas1